MQRTMMKSKIHRATVTIDADLDADAPTDVHVDAADRVIPEHEAVRHAADGTIWVGSPVAAP